MSGDYCEVKELAHSKYARRAPINAWVVNAFMFRRPEKKGENGEIEPKNSSN